jgi:hypothetical protein
MARTRACHEWRRPALDPVDDGKDGVPRRKAILPKCREGLKLPCSRVRRWRRSGSSAPADWSAACPCESLFATDRPQRFGIGLIWLLVRRVSSRCRALPPLCRPQPAGRHEASMSCLRSGTFGWHRKDLNWYVGAGPAVDAIAEGCRIAPLLDVRGQAIRPTGSPARGLQTRAKGPGSLNPTSHRSTAALRTADAGGRKATDPSAPEAGRSDSQSDAQKIRGRRILTGQEAETEPR